MATPVEGDQAPVVDDIWWGPTSPLRLTLVRNTAVRAVVKSLKTAQGSPAFIIFLVFCPQRSPMAGNECGQGGGGECALHVHWYTMISQETNMRPWRRMRQACTGTPRANIQTAPGRAFYPRGGSSCAQVT
jgi:hypothetical protein